MIIDPDSDPYQSGVVHYQDGTDKPLGEVNANRVRATGAVVRPEDVPVARRHEQQRQATIAMLREQQRLAGELLPPGTPVLIEVSRVLNSLGEKVRPE